MYTPKEHEEIFDIKPVGVRYICEFCNKGEMKADPNYAQADARDVYPHNLFPHKCTECGKEMLLPKIYPYIEWERVSDK